MRIAVLWGKCNNNILELFGGRKAPSCLEVEGIVEKSLAQWPTLESLCQVKQTTGQKQTRLAALRELSMVGESGPIEAAVREEAGENGRSR